MAVIELNADNFDAEAKSGKVLIDFWASWCGPCKKLAPILEEVSEDYDDLKFAKLNTEDHTDLIGDYQITGIPCLIIFNDGEEVDRIVGFHEKDDLKIKIDAVLAKI